MKILLLRWMLFSALVLAVVVVEPAHGGHDAVVEDDGVEVVDEEAEALAAPAAGGQGGWEAVPTINDGASNGSGAPASDAEEDVDDLSASTTLFNPPPLEPLSATDRARLVAIFSAAPSEPLTLATTLTFATGAAALQLPSSVVSSAAALHVTTSVILAPACFYLLHRP
jgi:hypothetical protein